jgi:hypothetical protein
VFLALQKQYQGFCAVCASYKIILVVGRTSANAITAMEGRVLEIRQADVILCKGRMEEENDERCESRPWPHNE